MPITEDQIAEILQQQSRLIELLAEQQTKSDISKQNITFDNFNEKFDCYLLRLQNFFNIKKLTADDAPTKKAKAQILINSIGSKHVQFLKNELAPETIIDKTYNDLVVVLKSILVQALTYILHNIVCYLEIRNHTKVFQHM